MNDELERIWNEAVMASSRYYPSICLEGLRKPTKHDREICNGKQNLVRVLAV
jgi:hypothetical protein